MRGENAEIRRTIAAVNAGHSAAIRTDEFTRDALVQASLLGECFAVLRAVQDMIPSTFDGTAGTLMARLSARMERR